jgi:hypothetical protein
VGSLTPAPIIRPKLNYIGAPTIQLSIQRCRSRSIVIARRDESHDMAHTVYHHIRISLRAVGIRVMYPYSRQCRRAACNIVKDELAAGRTTDIPNGLGARTAATRYALCAA